jgi:hypothetical protein
MKKYRLEVMISNNVYTLIKNALLGIYNTNIVVKYAEDKIWVRKLDSHGILIC